jgi:hypothetical protein
MFGRECLRGAQVGVARSFSASRQSAGSGEARMSETFLVGNVPGFPGRAVQSAADSTDSGGAAGRTEGSSMPAAGGLVRPGQWERNLLKVSPPHPLFQRAFTAARTAMQAAPGPLVCGHGGLPSKRDYGGHGLALSFPGAPHAGPDPIVNTRQCIHGNDTHGGAGELLASGRTHVHESAPSPPSGDVVDMGEPVKIVRSCRRHSQSEQICPARLR